MRRITIYIALFFVGLHMQAQEIKGIWFAGCNLKIDKDAGVDEYKIDSLYGVEGSVIDFISNEVFVIKSLGEKARQGVYRKMGDTLEMSIEQYKWHGLLTDSGFTLTLIDSSDYKLELFYKKLKPSSITENKLMTTEKIGGTNWRMAYPQDYLMVYFSDRDDPDLDDKPLGYISHFSKDKVQTELGNYQIDNYKNHLFLYLLGRESFLEQVMYFSDYNSGTYSGFLFDCKQPFNRPILSEKVQWSKTDMLDEQGLIAEEGALNGRYQVKLLKTESIGESAPVKSVILYLELKKDASCSIEAYVTGSIDEVAVLRKLEKFGRWELHPSGHFIKIIFENGQEQLLTIQREKVYTILFLDKNPWPEEKELNTVLKFKKQSSR